MWTLGRLFEPLVDRANLERAAELTVRGKRRRPDVAWFLIRRDTVLARIERELRAGCWMPAGFDLLFLRDPKPRVIARAPLEDRIVHAALVERIEPAFLSAATDDDFACRPGYGTHRARIRLLEALRAHRFFLHLDIQHYFPSIDLGLLRALLARRIRDRRFLDLVDRVLESGAGLYDGAAARRHARMSDAWPPRGGGLPIGARTSQLFAAHVLLAELDQRVRREWRVPAYVRYVDDLFLFADCRAELRRVRAAIGAWLWRERRLRLKVPEARVRAAEGHVDALGKRITRTGIEPFRSSWTGLRAAVARELFPRGARRRPDIRRVIASAVGHYLYGM